MVIVPFVPQEGSAFARYTRRETALAFLCRFDLYTLHLEPVTPGTSLCESLHMSLTSTEITRLTTAYGLECRTPKVLGRGQWWGRWVFDSYNFDCVAMEEDRDKLIGFECPVAVSLDFKDLQRQY